MVPFVYLASVCRSLQCPISALTQAGRGGLLFRFTCSVVLWGGRDAADKCHWLCGEHSQCSGHTGFAPAHGLCFPRLHCSGSRLLSRERALGCVYFPGLSFSVQVFGSSTKTQTRLGLRFVPSPSEQLRPPGA